MKYIISVLCLGVALGYGLLSYHFILFDSGVRILRKSKLQYENTFVDARGTKKLKLLLKPDLIEAGIGEAVNKTESAIRSRTE